MVVNHKKDLVYLSWPQLDMLYFVRHCFSTRLGGVSEGMFSSMNLSFTRGDKETAVRENFERLAAAVGFSTEDIVCPIRPIPLTFVWLPQKIGEKGSFGTGTIRMWTV